MFPSLPESIGKYVLNLGSSSAFFPVAGKEKKEKESEGKVKTNHENHEILEKSAESNRLNQLNDENIATSSTQWNHNHNQVVNGNPSVLQNDETELVLPKPNFANILLSLKNRVSTVPQKITIPFIETTASNSNADVRFVNPKQLNRIIKRRAQKDELGYGAILRRPFLNKSRHLHAMNRERIKGKFVKKIPEKEVSESVQSEK